MANLVRRFADQAFRTWAGKTRPTEGVERLIMDSSISDESGAPWIVFAGIMLMIAGVMRFFDALWAFHYHRALPENFQGAVFGHSLSTYGWIYLAVAIVLFLAGLGVFVQSQVARWIGVAAAAFAAISSIWWMPYYPLWSITYIGLGALVVYALVAHGGRRESAPLHRAT